MMWIHHGGWTRCCEHDLRCLLFSFLSTRGRTLKVNQRPHILTRMFGLRVTRTHSKPQSASAWEYTLFRRNKPNGGCIFYGPSFFKHISPLAANNPQKRQIYLKIWKALKCMGAVIYDYSCGIRQNFQMDLADYMKETCVQVRSKIKLCARSNWICQI